MVTVILAAVPMILSELLPIVSVFVPKVPEASTMQIKLYTAGDAGRVNVQAPPEVSAMMKSPALAEYVVVLVT